MYIVFITITVFRIFIKKENCLINGPNHVISSMDRVIKIQLVNDYQYTLLKCILFNSSMLDQYEIKLI